MFCQPVPCLITAEAQCADVRTNVGLEALEMTDREVCFLASLYRLISPKGNQHTEGDDNELVYRQSPATEKTAYESRCPKTIIRHVASQMSESGLSLSVPLLTAKR